LLLACASSERATGRTFLAAHDQPISTRELVGMMRRHLGRPRRLVCVAPAALEMGAGWIGRGAAIRRLTRSLEADPSAAQEALGWRARVGPEAAIEEMARAWRHEAGA
jgi:nucleoside-diphosphate-sugar epimerase